MDLRTDDELAKILWDYNNIQQPVKKSDCILALGNNDIRVAHRAAQLFLSGYAPLIIFSGGFGDLTRQLYSKPEAEIFADEAVKLGVPLDKIYLENKSTNTGENIIFSKRLIKNKKLDIKSIILVSMPYMLRRAFATFKKQWPKMNFTVTGPVIDFTGYTNETISKELLINSMVGDTQRIKLYPSKGFQIPQKLPTKVWRAFEELVQRGYTKRLVKE
jgi:uncharacterized SAM-binding protein YcdF (DUF218 family)